MYKWNNEIIKIKSLYSIDDSIHKYFTSYAKCIVSSGDKINTGVKIQIISITGYNCANEEIVGTAFAN